MDMKKQFPGKYFKFNILDENNNLKYQDIEGEFNNDYIKFETTDAIMFSVSDIISKKYDDKNKAEKKYKIINYDYKKKSRIRDAYYKVEITPISLRRPTHKIEITNTFELSENLSEALGISKKTIEKFLEHKVQIKKLFEEHNFLSADFLTIAKENLELAKNKDNHLDIDKTLSVINILISIFTSIK